MVVYFDVHAHHVLRCGVRDIDYSVVVEHCCEAHFVDCG